MIFFAGDFNLTEKGFTIDEEDGENKESKNM